MKKEVAGLPQTGQRATAPDNTFSTFDEANTHPARADDWPPLTDTAPIDGGFDTYDNTLPTGSTRAYVAGHWVPLATRPHVADVHALTVYGKDGHADEPQEQEPAGVAIHSPASPLGTPNAMSELQPEPDGSMTALQRLDTPMPPIEAAMRESSRLPSEVPRPSVTRARTLEPSRVAEEFMPASATDMQAARAIESAPHVKLSTSPDAADLHAAGQHSMTYLPGTLAPDDHALPDAAIPRLTGHAPGGALVQILDNDGPIGSAIANADGRWTYHLDAPLATGTHALMLKINDGPPSTPMRLFVEPAVSTDLVEHADNHSLAPIHLHVDADAPHDKQADTLPQEDSPMHAAGLLGDPAQSHLVLDFSGLAARLAPAEAMEPGDHGFVLEAGLDTLRLDALLTDAGESMFDSPPAEGDTLPALDDALVHEMLSQPPALSDVASYGDLYVYSDAVLPALEASAHHMG